MMHKILVIDDDRDLRDLVKAQLELKHYQVYVAAHGVEGLQRAYQLHPDVILLDIMMPDIGGWEVCRRLREMSTVPIIMLTACVRPDDVVKGLKLGADDYITKPFHSRELEARIKSVLRRSCEVETSGKPAGAFFTNGHLMIDLERRSAKVRGERIDFTPTEFKLLETLVRNEGRILPHRYLLNEVWGPEYADQVGYVKLYIRYLRQKIESDPSRPHYIQTEWGVGYRFNGI